MKRTMHLFATAVALLFFAGTHARADFVEWTYAWTRSPEGGAVLAGTGGVTLTNQLESTAVGSSDVVATNLRVFSTSNPLAGNELDTLTTGDYSLTIAIKDVASGATGSLTFSGVLSGNFSTLNANVANTFVGLTTQQLVLGDNTYVVTIGSYTPPGPDGAANAGSISAHVEVIPGGGVAVETPEPSTLVLSCFGLSMAGLARWRRRRGAAV